MAEQKVHLTEVDGISSDGTVRWPGPPCREDLGVEMVPLTLRQRRAAFRGLRLLALLVERIDPDRERDENADALRDLARVVLPEGIGVELEAGE